MDCTAFFATRIAAAALCAAACYAALPAMAQEPPPDAVAEVPLHHVVADYPAQIRVSGDAVILTRPDHVLIALGVETVNENIETSKRQNAAIVVAAIEALKGFGIDGQQIHIDEVSVVPHYRDEFRQGVVHYRSRNAFTVTVDHAAKVEPVVSAAMQAGVNYVHGVSHRTSELAQHQNAARAAALQAARDKAESMAAVLGRQLGAPLQIQEGDGSWDYFSGSNYWGQAPRSGSASALGSGHAPGTDGTSSIGEIAVRATANVVFELVD